MRAVHAKRKVHRRRPSLWRKRCPAYPPIPVSSEDREFGEMFTRVIEYIGRAFGIPKNLIGRGQG